MSFTPSLPSESLGNKKKSECLITLNKYPVIISLINEYIKDEYVYITRCKFTRNILHTHTYFPLHLECQKHIITKQKINVVEEIQLDLSLLICYLHHFVNHKDHTVVHVYVNHTNHIISAVYDETLLYDILGECMHSWAALNFTPGI